MSSATSDLPLSDALLLPAADGPAAGHDLRADVTPRSLYFRLRDARSEARASERSADNDPEADGSPTRHWQTVRELAIEALGESKDLEVAGWLTESVVRSDGLAGLRASAELLKGLVERYWEDGLHPLPDEDGIEGRVAPIAGLNGQGSDGTLLQPLRKLVLFEDGAGQPVTFWRYEQAEQVAGVGDEARRAQLLEAGAPVLAELEAQAASTGRASIAALAAQAAPAVGAWRALEAALAAAAGRDAPPTRRVLDLLERIQRLLQRYAPEAAPSAAAELAAPATVAADAAPAREPRSPGREHLLAEISRIAAVFRATEPTSPLGYTLEEAVRRARLPWPDLLREMIPDLEPRAAFLSSLGIRPPAD